MIDEVTRRGSGPNLWPPGAGLTALIGPNFSGRTQALRELTGMEGSGCTESAYVPLEVYNVLSGLAPTVGGELILHAGIDVASSPVRDLVPMLGLDALWHQHPFAALSGGEQAMLAVVCALALAPRTVAVDCALEQLDRGRRKALLGWLETYARDSVVIVADNRLREMDGLFPFCCTVPEEAASHLRPGSMPIGRVEAARFSPPQNLESYPLRLAGLRFGYRAATPVLRDISIDLNPGTIYILEGANGAGKSTLAKLLFGERRPDGGHVFARGTEVQPWKRPGRLVAYHFQNPDVQLFSTTVESEVRAGLVAKRGRHDVASAAVNAERTAMLLDTFGISDVRKRHPADLAFTLRKRIALAATLAMETPWIILDEPTLGQDDATAEQIARILESLRETGAGIVVITHSSWFQERLCGTLLRLDEGRLQLGGRHV